MFIVDVKIEAASPELMPTYETEGAAGMDLRAAHSLVVAPGGFGLVKTGIRIELPVGYEAQVRSRSGLALKQGLFVLNSPGTIDADYRGEIGVILANFGPNDVRINARDRIAQLVVSRVERVVWQIEALSPSERGAGGFGSTGQS